VFALDPKRGITQFAHRSWGTADHIEEVRAICQTADGYVWVGTVDGLFKFDGFTFSRWEPKPGEAVLPGIPQAALPGIPHSLLASKDGGLWVGGMGTMTLILGGHTKMYSLMVGTERGDVRSLCQAQDGTIWAGTSKGLFKFTGKDWQRLGPETGIPNEQISSVLIDRENTLWLGTQDQKQRPESRIAFLREGETRFRISSERCDETDMLAQAPDGKIWTAQVSRSVRAFTFGPTNIQFVAPEIRVGSQAILFDRDGGLWIPTVGDGLRRVRNMATLGTTDIAQFSDEVDKFTQKDGLSSDIVTCVFEDREGGIWFGTTAGLDFFRDNKITPISAREGLPFDQELCVAAGQDGSIWAGAGLEGFIQLVRGQDRFIKREWLGLDTSVDGVSPTIYCIYGDRGGDLVLGTGVGVAVYGQKEGRAKVLSEVPDLKTVLAITRDAAGALWLCDRYLGVFRLFEGNLRHFPELDRDWDGWVYAAHTDSRGRVWFGLGSGEVALHEAGKFRVFAAKDGLSPGPVCAILSGKGGDVWAAGKGGLSRYRNNRFELLNRANGLPFEDLFAALQDDDGFFWLAGEMGLFRVAEAELDAALPEGRSQITGEQFDLNDGLRGVVRHNPFGLRGVGYSVAAKGTDGKLWFATTAGLAIIDPHQIPRSSVLALVHIQQMIAGAKTYFAGAPLRLPAGIRECEIRYTALTFGNPARVFYRYKLEGADQDWQEVKTRRQTSFNLRPGKYRFRVAACNDDGIWNESEDRLEFVIPRMFYETAWFPFLCLAPVALVLWGLHRLRLAQLASRMNLQLAAQRDERKRIAQELHDTLLQGFTGVGLKLEALATGLPPALSKTKAQLENALEQIDQYLAEARRSVWKLRSPALESTYNFQEALAKVSERALADSGIHLSFSSQGKERKLKDVVEENLLRICEESVANAAKHARPTRVEVTLEFNPADVQLRIRDNGCGFDTSGSKEGHFGLVGMRERVKSMDGRFSLNSQPVAGTEIAVTIPIKS
jgi:signal transduction histidine kinase/ligand-binding sensor domain-containing protein